MTTAGARALYVHEHRNIVDIARQAWDSGDISPRMKQAYQEDWEFIQREIASVDTEIES